MTSNFLSVQRPPCSGLTPISFTQNLLWRTCSPSALQNVSIHTLEIHDTSSASQRHSTGPQSPMLSMRHVRDFDFVVLQCLLNRNLLEVRHDGWKLLHEGLIQNLNNMSNFLRELGRCISELTQDLILVMGLARTKGVLNSFVSHRREAHLPCLPLHLSKPLKMQAIYSLNSRQAFRIFQTKGDPRQSSRSVWKRSISNGLSTYPPCS